MANDFAAQIGAWGRRSNARMRAIVQTAAQSMIEESNTPQARGGRMPIDTGFLTNSGLAALNTMPSGPSKPEDGWSFEPSALVIARFQIGDRLTYGWTANYAVYMEARYAFMRGAAQNWPRHVADAARTVEKRVMG